MKIAKYIFSFLFLLFALVQYNDIDWYLWMPVYTIVSILIFISIKKRVPKNILWLCFFILLLWLIILIPDLLKWISDGLPNIAGTMQASNPEIELMREFFGVLICLIAIALLIQPTLKNKNI